MWNNRNIQVVWLAIDLIFYFPVYSTNVLTLDYKIKNGLYRVILLTLTIIPVDPVYRTDSSTLNNYKMYALRKILIQ